MSTPILSVKVVAIDTEIGQIVLTRRSHSAATKTMRGAAPKATLRGVSLEYEAKRLSLADCGRLLTAVDGLRLCASRRRCFAIPAARAGFEIAQGTDAIAASIAEEDISFARSA
jgi:hypothetical protein